METQVFSFETPLAPPQPPAPITSRHVFLSQSRRRIRLAILDDHPVITLALPVCLQSYPGVEVAHTDTSPTRFFEAIKPLNCDAAIVDFHMPGELWDGANYFRRLRRQFPEMVIIAFSGTCTQESRYAIFRAGANAYLSKRETPATLVESLHLARQHPQLFFVCEDGKLQAKRLVPPLHRLTLAETEVLRHIALGMSVTEISNKLLRSKKTISTHKRRAMKKLNLTNDLSLALYLKENFSHHDG